MSDFQRTRHSLRACALAALIAAVVAHSASAQQSADGSNHAATVKMTDTLKFEPAKITITAGEAVLWKNEPSSMMHTVTAVPDLAKKPENVALPEGAETFDSGKMQPGDTFTHQFTVPGHYKYFCIPHELAGMVAEVEVKPADDSKQAADAKPADESKQAADAKPAQGGEAQRAESDTEQTTEGAADDNDTGDTMILGTHTPPRPEGYRQATGFMKFVYWLGNFHPAGTDVPIGAIFAALVSEVLLVLTGKQVFAGVTRFCVWFAGLCAIFVGIGGWCLAGFRFDDPNWMLETHRWFGTSTALWMIILIGIMEAANRKDGAGLQWLFRLSLLAGVILITVTGFYGGAMIYGIDHYAWPQS